MQYQNFEIFKHVSAWTSHHLHKLRRQLERRVFKAQILGRAGENEAIVNVYDVPLIVEENVAIVAILHL